SKHSVTMNLPRDILQYSLDPSAYSFKPDNFVDTGSVVLDLMELSSVFDQIYSKHPVWPDSLRRLAVPHDRQEDRKVTLTDQNEYMVAMSIGRGLQSGTRYAE